MACKMQMWEKAYENLQNCKFDGYDLSGADLVNVNLHNADLSEVNLNNANLKKANLSRCRLYKSNLSGVNLEIWERSSHIPI